MGVPHASGDEPTSQKTGITVAEFDVTTLESVLDKRAEFYLTYSPHKEGRTFLMPQECFQVLHVRFGLTGKLVLWNWETPHSMGWFD